MEKLTFFELAIKVLKEANKPMTIDEIWRYAQERGYDLLVGSKGKTPWQTIGARIYVDMRDNPNSPFVKIDSKPKKFFLKELQNVDTIKEEKEIIQPKETDVSLKSGHREQRDYNKLNYNRFEVSNHEKENI